MKSLDQFFQSDLLQALGWTIIHSFWQGLLIILILTVGLVLLRKHSSQLRYFAGYLALIAMTICSAYTFAWHLDERPASVAISSSQVNASDVAIDISAIPVSEITTPNLAGENYWQLIVRFLEGSLPLITMVWMLGVLILTLKLLAELAYIQRLKYQPGQPTAEFYQELVNKLSQQMGIEKIIEIKENIRISSPMVIGFIKPVILVPFGLLNQLETEEVESILSHELAHIRRYDYVFNLFQSLVEILLFFNPAIWWISSFIRSEREYCCDEMAIAETGNQLVFVQTLAKLEEYRSLPNSMAMAFNGQRDGGVLQRVKRIINSEEQFRVPYRLFWSCIILLGSLGVFAFQGQPVFPSDPIDETSVVIPESELLESSNLKTPTNTNLPGTAQSADLEKEERTSLEENQDTPVDVQKATIEDVAEITSSKKDISPNELDTVPENVKKLKKELIQLERSFQEQEFAIQKQSRDVQTQMLTLERKIQEIENEQLKKLFELEKNVQEIELNRDFQMQEFEVEYNTIQNETLELEYKLQHLEKQISEQGINSIWDKQRSELHQQLIELKKKKSEIELSQKQNNLNIEKEIQLNHNKRWQLQKEAEINRSNIQLQMMELKHKLQEVQFKGQLLQNEKQNKIQLLQLKMQEELEN